MAVTLVDSGISFHDTNNVSSITGSVTLTAGADFLAITAHNDGSGTVSSVTYNGVALTKKVSAASNFFGNIKNSEGWYLANPATGAAHNLVVTWTAARQDMGFTVQSFSGYGSLGAAYSNTSPVNGTSADPTVTVSDWASGDFAFGALLIGGGAPTAGDTSLVSYSSIANNDNYVNSEYQTADGNLNWTHAADAWASIGFAIKPAAASSVMPILMHQNRMRRAA